MFKDEYLLDFINVEEVRKVLPTEEELRQVMDDESDKA